MEMAKKSIISVILAASMMASLLTGCSGLVATNDATKVGLTPALTQQEVLDYYAKALDYDTVVSRAAEAQVYNYVTSPVNDETVAKRINETLAITEQALATDNYHATDKTSKYLTDSMYHYIRAMLNDKKLTNRNVLEARQALGYYFVDVQYDIAPADIGTFKDAMTLVGMNGAFHYIETRNEDIVDASYMTKAEKEMNDYFASEKIDLVAKYDSANKSFKCASAGEVQNPISFDNTTLGEPEVIPEVVPEVVPDVVPTEGTPEGTVEVTPEPTPEPTPAPTPIPVANETPNKSTGGISTRVNPIDLDVFNKVVGYGTHTSYIPKLDLVYNIPSTGGAVTGVGLYPCGALGMVNFGFNRSNLTGTCILRYLLKEDLVDPSQLSCENIYAKYYEITTGFNANFDSLIPNFLQEQFKTLIDRADRVMVNQDITGLMRGKVFKDIGMAALVGYTENYGNVLRQMSTLRRVISRNIENNSYLVEVECYRQEGDQTADLYATYRDTVYVVIEQDGSDFVITDWIIMNRQLITEPDIDPDAATAKRIVSLGLTSEPTEETKASAEKLLQELYVASSNRILYGPKELSDGTVIEKGMYDCFNQNVEMLPSTKKEEINNNIRKLLVKYGTTTSAQMNGKITSWIGGSTNQNQVEFTTEEVIQYQGRSSGMYMKCYYLMSCIEDTWVIDDIQIIESEPEELTGESLANVVRRITE